MAQNNPFSCEIDFEYGVVMPLSPIIRRFVVNNPGALTFKGTNAYILGRGEVAVIDPGPDDEAHVKALLKSLRSETITRIIITHTHRDHSGAVDRLRQLTGARTYGFRLGDAIRGAYSSSGGEATDRTIELATAFADTQFTPDVKLDDGDEIKGAGWSLQAVHTPGHAPDHLCYSLCQSKALFTGDHIMPWSTSVIAPPEGNMQDYMASLAKLACRDDELFLPGHGGRVRKPKRLVRAYILHRQWREKSIVKVVTQGCRQVEEIVPLLYREIDEDMKPAASLSVLAHLLHLVQKGKMQVDGEGLGASFTLAHQQEE